VWGWVKEIQDMVIKKWNPEERFQETEEKLLSKFSIHLKNCSLFISN
jgi:hypothetical protein